MPPKQTPLHMYKSEDRLASFEPISKPKARARHGWPLDIKTHPKLTPENMASAGFYYTPSGSDPNGDTCCCFLCGVTLGGWAEDDDPHKEHVDRGNCAWAETICQVELDRENGFIREYQTIEDLPSSATYSYVRENTYYSKDREECWWPHIKNKKHKVTPQALAKAGFVFTPSSGNSDLVKCPLCEYDVEEWDEDDDPLEQHRNKHPECLFFTAQAVVKGKKRAPRKTKQAKPTAPSEIDEVEAEPTQPARRTRQTTSELPPDAPITTTTKSKSTRSRPRRGKKADDLEEVEEVGDDVIVIDDEEEKVEKTKSVRRRKPKKQEQEEEVEVEEEPIVVLGSSKSLSQTQPKSAASASASTSTSTGTKSKPSRKPRTATIQVDEEEVGEEIEAEAEAEDEIEVEAPLGKSTMKSKSQSASRSTSKSKSKSKSNKQSNSEAEPELELESEMILTEVEPPKTAKSKSTKSKAKPEVIEAAESKSVSISAKSKTQTQTLAKPLPPLPPPSPAAAPAGAATTKQPLSNLDRFANIPPSSPVSAPAPLGRVTKAIPTKKVISTSQPTRTRPSTIPPPPQAIEQGAKAAKEVINSVLDTISPNQHATLGGLTEIDDTLSNEQLDMTMESWIRFEMEKKRQEIEREGRELISQFEQRTKEARRRIEGIVTRS